MASLTIRNLDDDVKRQLRVRAAKNGHSMEEEARVMLRIALRNEERPTHNLLQLTRRRFAKQEPVDLPIPEREPLRSPPEFGR